MRVPRLLDLFCKAGGAGMGYHLAGFEVVGVDIEPQPHYPFKFHQADAMEFPLDGFDVVHASPPCQRWSKGAGKAGTRHLHPDLIAATRERLRANGVPYVIENIEQARHELIEPLMLCGTMFDLGVFRHRYFECSDLVMVPQHQRHTGRVGDGRFVTVAGNPGGSSTRDGWRNGGADDWRRAMGIDWMTAAELAQAIPPAYTHHLGAQLLQHVLTGVGA